MAVKKMGIREGSFFYFFFEVGMETGNQGRFLFPLFKNEKWEKEPSLIPSFLPHFKNEKWEKEPSLIPSFSLSSPKYAPG